VTILYLDCGMGAAGDMLMGALYELADDKRGFLAGLSGLTVAGVEIEALASEKCGIAGTHMRVLVGGREEQSLDAVDVHDHGDHDVHHHGHEHTRHDDHDHHEHDHYDQGDRHDHDHHEHDGAPDHHHDPGAQSHTHTHSSLPAVSEIISGLGLPEEVRDDALAVYQLIAEAEAHVHRRPVDEVHFHEVGTLDAIADVVGVSLLMHELSPDEVVASPVHVGSGQVWCAHGLVPVPAPATAYLLRGIPTYGGEIRGELCTPTGAALLRHFVDRFEPQPTMAVERIGYGMGSKDFAAANCVRAMLGGHAGGPGTVIELAVNLDDMTGEAIGFAVEELFAAGALDVWTSPIGMKKGRPAVVLSCLCDLSRRDDLIATLFRHTSTLGVRGTPHDRWTLERAVEDRRVGERTVRVKRASGWGVTRAKAEYDDLATLARDEGVTLDEARRRVEGSS